jgi:hypothetical protein
MALGPSLSGPAEVAEVVAPRDLTPDELMLLQSGISQVRQVLDPLDPASIESLWKHLLETEPATSTAPARFVGVALGTLLLDREPTLHWVSCLGPNGWTPGVVSPNRPGSPVLVVADTLTRWRDRTADWVIPYLAGSHEHLMHPVPGSDEELPWFASPDDLPEPPSQAVRELSITALDLGLEVAGDEQLVIAVAPGPLSARCPEDPADAAAVHAWAQDWAAGSDARQLALIWIDPPRSAGRHAAAHAGSVLVEASEAGRPGLTLAHEYVTGPQGAEAIGQPVVVGPAAPLL